jgi:Rrf2 family protein
MHFKITTDYGIRVLIYLAKASAPLSPAKEIAEHIKISYHYFNKVAVNLKQAGLIESVQGPGGGYCLAEHVSERSIYDIIELLEGSIYINRCLEKNGFCSMYKNESPTCPVHQFFEMVQLNLIQLLKSKKICEFSE